MAFAALIHDTKHLGVTNAQLEAENHLVYQMHGERGCCQERHSLHCAFGILEDEFRELYDEVVFGCPRILHVIRKVVLSTDLESVEILRKRVEKFKRVMGNPCMSDRTIMERTHAAMEMILTMANIGHYAQNHQLFLQWSQASFQEKLQAGLFKSANDPREGWYTLQIEFFGDVILPLIDQIENILPQSHCGLREGAENNMKLWQEGGRQWMEANKAPKILKQVMRKPYPCFGFGWLFRIFELHSSDLSRTSREEMPGSHLREE
jgi:hypothetical protein